MTAQYVLREDAAELDRTIERLTRDIEDTEKRIVELRDKRDTARFHHAEMLAAANVLDNLGFAVEDVGGVITVRVDPLSSGGSVDEEGTTTTSD